MCIIKTCSPEKNGKVELSPFFKTPTNTARTIIEIMECNVDI